MQHIQGDLQMVFNALYELGVIEPVLKMDWNAGLRELEAGSAGLQRAIQIVNHCGCDLSRLKNELRELDQRSLEVLAMEVAREYAGFHTREDVLQ
jgi:hypothetical protein